MNQANIRFITLGGNRYALDLLNPLEAIAWGNRAISLFGPALGRLFGAVDFEKIQDLDLAGMGLAEAAGRVQGLVATALSSCGEIRAAEATALMTEAIQRCYTPANEPLRDAAVFNAWFRGQPGDLYPLGVLALVHLVKDFFPSRLATVASALKTKTETEHTT